jgi:folate-binding protein YgfZ
VARLEAGYPIFGQDITEKTLVMEMGPDYIARHLSFDKGCYTGQEVVHRIYSRGHTNRQWVALVGDGPMPVGAQVSHAERPDAGVVTSSATSAEFGSIAAAMIRADFAKEGEQVSVNGIGADVVEMPLRR